MPLPVKRSTPPLRSSQWAWPLDGITTGGLTVAMVMAWIIGGLPVLGLAFVVAALYAHNERQRFMQLEQARMHQENLSHLLLARTSPEEIAALRAVGLESERELFDFLQALVSSYGGESTRGTGRLPAQEQQEAVAPGISLSLSHDLGHWYAKLQLHGETGRQFLNGEYTQWKGKGTTPQAAVTAVIKKCGAARQARAIQDYATKLVVDDDA